MKCSMAIKRCSPHKKTNMAFLYDRTKSFFYSNAEHPDSIIRCFRLYCYQTLQKEILIYLNFA
jgi:hypothetical protein